MSKFKTSVLRWFFPCWFAVAVLACVDTTVDAPSNAVVGDDPSPAASTQAPGNTVPITTLALSDGQVVEFFQAENELTVGVRGTRGQTPPVALTRGFTVDPLAIYRELSGTAPPRELVAAVAAARATVDEDSSDEGEYPVPSAPIDVSAAATAAGTRASCGYSAYAWSSMFCANAPNSSWIDQYSCHPVWSGNYKFQKKGRWMGYHAQATTHAVQAHLRYKKGLHWKPSVDVTILPCQYYYWTSACISCSKRWRKAEIVDNDEDYVSRIFASNHE